MQIVDKNAKYHSSPQREGQSTVENAIKSIDHQEETDIRNKYLISQKSYKRFLNTFFLFFYINLDCDFPKLAHKHMLASNQTIKLQL